MCSAEFIQHWAVMKGVVGWELLWLRHSRRPDVEEFYLTPGAVKPANKAKAALSAHVGLIEVSSPPLSELMLHR